MALFSVKLETLKKLFVEELRDLYDAESQLTKALPRLMQACRYDALGNLLQQHLNVTKLQIDRLHRVFEMLKEKPAGKTCKGMKGLIEESEDLLSRGHGSSVIDAGIIGCAQRFEHYEIAAYGTARTYAELLGHTEIAEMLGETLNEEKDADKALTHIARSVNVEAKAA